MRRNRSAALAAAFLILGASAVTSVAVSSAAAAPSRAAHDDFNADGYPDLVVSAPSATVNGKSGAGYVAVMYGSSKGLSKAKRTVISQSTAGVPGAPEKGDAFGKVTASGDFDQDGFPDLVVAAPGEDVGTVRDAGGVTVLWGSAKGITGHSVWLEADTPVAKGAFGTGLAAGDFYAERTDQLAVLTADELWLYAFPSPGKDGAGARRSVRAAVRPTGVRAEDTVTVTGLAAGDFDRDNDDDLVILGKSAGSDETVPWGWYKPGSPAGPEEGVFFPAGTVGIAADMDGDGYAELVSSYPDQVDEAGRDDTGGMVHVYYGDSDGLADRPRHQTFTQDTRGMPGDGEPLDRFGSDLSVGDVNGDGYDDVAIGARGEDVGAVKDAGAVWVLRSDSASVLIGGARLYHQDTKGIPGAAEAGDQWGAQVRLIDADRNGKADLVTAAPGENGGDGAVWVMNGTSSGLTATGSWTFGGASLGAPAAGARFGSTLGE